MIERVHKWVDDQLESAEQERICAVALSKAEVHRFRQAVDEGFACEVATHRFARKELWQTELSAGERTLYLMRTAQKMNPELVFAGPSAAVAYGLSVSNRYLTQLWVKASPGTHRRNDAGVRSILVARDNDERVSDLRVTSRARTIGDCLRVMDFRAGLAVADSALRTWSTSWEDLWENVREACPRMSGIHRVEGVVRLANGRAESGGESIARAVMLELGIAPPVLQRVFTSPIDRELMYRVDFSWDVASGAILAELDGSEKYESPAMRGDRSVAQVIGDEHRRQSHIEADQNVLRVIRFGLADAVRVDAFLRLLVGCGVPRTFAMDECVLRAGGVLRCR